MKHSKTRLIPLLTLLLLIGGFAGLFRSIRAQESVPSSLPEGVAISGEVCAPAMTQLWTAATAACINKPVGYACNGGSAPHAEPAGPVASTFTSTGSLVEVGELDLIQTPSIEVGQNQVGIAYLRLESPISVTVLSLGEVTLRDVSPPDFPAWQSILVQTATGFAACGAAPLSVVILQSPQGGQSRIVVNGASLAMNGTVLIHTTESQTVFASLSGLTSVTTYGQEAVFYPGQQITTSYANGDFSAPTGPASAATPFDAALTRHLPVSLFDRPLVLPQPGSVVTQGSVNLRSQPTTSSGVITQIPAGEILSVLGRTTDGQWYNVRRLSGDTGWMAANLLLRNIGAIEAVYEATPIPPQRFGELGSQGQVVSATGVNLRRGPDVVFPALVTIPNETLVNLLARSPYSPWVKIEVGGLEGWVALVNIQTQAFIDALPIDFNAPPLPPPTAIPGSFGNAFPDPNRGG